MALFENISFESSTSSSNSLTGGKRLHFKLTGVQKDTTGLNSLPYYTEITNAKFGIYSYASGSNVKLQFFIGKPGSLTDNSGSDVYSSHDYASSSTTLSTDSSYTPYQSGDIASYFNVAPGSNGYINDRLLVATFYNSNTLSSRTVYYKKPFIILTYKTPTVVVKTAKTGEGTVTGAKTLEILTRGGSDSTTLKATAAAGYRFVKWTDGVTSNTRIISYSDSNISKNVTEVTYTAVFEPTGGEMKITEAFMLKNDNTQISEQNKIDAGGQGLLIKVKAIIE